MSDEEPSELNEVAFRTRHTIGETLKLGAYGGIGGAALATAFVGAATMGIPWIGGGLALLGITTGAGATVLGSVATTGAMYGAGLGAAAGVVKGAAGSGDAFDDAKDREREEKAMDNAKKERLSALEQRHAQQKAIFEQQFPGGQNLPMGKGVGPAQTAR